MCCLSERGGRADCQGCGRPWVAGVHFILAAPEKNPGAAQHSRTLLLHRTALHCAGAAEPQPSAPIANRGRAHELQRGALQARATFVEKGAVHEQEEEWEQ